MNTAIKKIIDKIENDSMQSYTYTEVLEMLSNELETESYTKQDLKTAWDSSANNMYLQFSSSSYKGILFDKWFNSFKEIR